MFTKVYKGNIEIKSIYIGSNKIKYNNAINPPPDIECEWKEQEKETSGYLTNPFVFYSSHTIHNEGDVIFLVRVAYVGTASARVGLAYAEGSNTNVTFSSTSIKGGDIVEIKLVYENGKANIYSKRNNETNWTFGNEYTRYNQDYLALIGFGGSSKTEIWLQK